MFRLSLRLIPAICVLVLLPEVSHAGDGAINFAEFIYNQVIVQALIAFTGIAAAFLLFYAFRMILEAQKEQAGADARKSFINAFFGFVTIAIAGGFVTAFATSGFSGSTITTINPDALRPGLDSVVTFIISAAAGVFFLMVTLAGIRMMLTQGDSAEFTKWTKVLVANIIGVVVMLLARIVVVAIQARSAAAITTEVVGIALFVLTILGFACALALIVAGVLLIISVDESLKERAKKIIFGTLITLVVILALGAIIRAFVVVGSGT